MWVDSKSVSRRYIKGIFRKFIYYNWIHKGVVYCHSQKDFEALVNLWNEDCRRYFLPYVYTFENPEGEPIQLEDIPIDQNFKPKMYIQHRNGVWCIQ